MLTIKKLTLILMPLNELLEQKHVVYRLVRFYVVAHYIDNNKNLTIDIKKTMKGLFSVMRKKVMRKTVI
jgi:hypothetical protein